MSKRFTGFFELLLLGVVILSIVLGVGWVGNSSAQAIASPQQPGPARSSTQAEAAAAAAPAAITVTAPAIEAGLAVTPTVDVTPTMVATPVPFDPQTEIEANDAPLLVQAPGTVNILLLGSDASVDDRYARTDTMIIASINPDMPSVSMLSLPRDLQVRIPGRSDDRLNIAYELGYINEYPGGGPAFLAAVLRKNFGIKIDHFMRVDFGGFIKAIDTLGGVDVLVECELHDTFPDKSSPRGKTDLDVYPGIVHLGGKEALWYARSRWSTTDFDRARRQQKVLRALFSKAKSSNLLQNAIGLYGDFRDNVETSVGLGRHPILRRHRDPPGQPVDQEPRADFPDRPGFHPRRRRASIDPLQRHHSLHRRGAVAAGRQPRAKPTGGGGVEWLEPATTWSWWRPSAWLGKVSRSRMPGSRRSAISRTPRYSITRSRPRGRRSARLASIFGVRRNDIISQSDPSSDVAATIVLGENYNSCPQTATIAGDVPLAPDQAEATPTAEPTTSPEP